MCIPYTRYCLEHLTSVHSWETVVGLVILYSGKFLMSYLNTVNDTHLYIFVMYFLL